MLISKKISGEITDVVYDYDVRKKTVAGNKILPVTLYTIKTEDGESKALGIMHNDYFKVGDSVKMTLARWDPTFPKEKRLKDYKAIYKSEKL